MISIHPPHAGRDQAERERMEAHYRFQSTLPMRGGTLDALRMLLAVRISIHPPHAGRDIRSVAYHPALTYFNPPSPCGEGHCWRRSIPPPGRFQSTLPMRGGTDAIEHQGIPDDISIHPPHAGRDGRSPAHPGRDQHFNPPSPCGEGRRAECNSGRNQRFQSTLPMRGGTLQMRALINRAAFQSTLPMRGGTILFRQKSKSRIISIHPPHAGRDSSTPP